MNFLWSIADSISLAFGRLPLDRRRHDRRLRGLLERIETGKRNPAKADAEALRLDAEAILGDWETVLGPREFWPKPVREIPTRRNSNVIPFPKR